MNAGCPKAQKTNARAPNQPRADPGSPRRISRHAEPSRKTVRGAKPAATERLRSTDKAASEQGTAAFCSAGRAAKIGIVPTCSVRPLSLRQANFTVKPTAGLPSGRRTGEVEGFVAPAGQSRRIEPPRGPRKVHAILLGNHQHDGKRGRARRRRLNAMPLPPTPRRTNPGREPTGFARGSRLAAGRCRTDRRGRWAGVVHRVASRCGDRQDAGLCDRLPGGWRQLAAGDRQPAPRRETPLSVVMEASAGKFFSGGSRRGAGRGRPGHCRRTCPRTCMARRGRDRKRRGVSRRAWRREIA